MVDHSYQTPEIERISAFVAQRERRILVRTIIGTAVAALLAGLLIAYSAKYSYDAFRDVDEAQKNEKAQVERRDVLNIEIAAKEARIAELEKGISQLEQVRNDTQRADIARNLIPAQQAEQGSRLIYLQFRGALSRDTMRGLQNILQDEKYSAPGIERVASTYNSEVRYFRKEDERNAQDVAAIATKYFSGRCALKEKVPVKYIAETKPPPQIEIWISINCGE